MSALSEKTAPPEELVTLPEAKEHLRVTHDDEDSYITGLIVVARRTCEQIQRRSYVDTVWELWLECWPDGRELELTRTPLSAVASVKYYDTADLEATMPAADYIVDDVSTPGRIVLRDAASWPTATLRAAKGIVVEFTSGHGATAAEVPADFKHLVKLLLTHLYRQREPVVTGTTATSIPFSLEVMLNKDRVGGFVS